MASKKKKSLVTTRLEKLLILVILILLGTLYLLTQKAPSKYVTSFTRRPQFYQETGKLELTTPAQKQAQQTLLSMAEDMKQYDWIKNITDYGFVTILDADNAKFTVSIDKGKVEVVPGWVKKWGENPNMVIEIDTFRLNRLAGIIADGEIEDSEIFEVASVALVDALDSIYQSDVLYYPGDKRILKLENFYHIIVENEYGLLDQYGNLLKAEATVINVDGQWLVSSGLQGKPDATYKLNVDELIEYYALINYEFGDVAPQDLLKRKALLDRYMDLRERTVVK